MLELVAALENVEIRDVALLAAEWFHIKPGCLAHHQRKEKPMSGERPSHKAFVVEDRGEGQEADAF